jgi:hypothetical protein
MTRNEIVEKTLTEIRSRFEGREEPYSEEPDHEEIVIATLRERLPETDIKTCEDFQLVQAQCCETCHTFYPHYDMKVIDLPDGSRAWVCDPLKDGVYSERDGQSEHR